jgi:O-6-methylguanine DNA methyltransferase
MSDFTTQVKSIVSKIPKGKVATYKEVAISAGNPKAARAVASVMKANYDSDVPCHRVIRSDGGLGGYNRGGIIAKKKLLLEEGVVL